MSKVSHPNRSPSKVKGENSELCAGVPQTVQVGPLDSENNGQWVLMVNFSWEIGIDPHAYLCQYHFMNRAKQKIKRITANLPEILILQAISVTKSNLTETLIKGLEMVKRSGAFDKAQKLKGKLNLTIDLDKSRERPRR